MKNTRIIIACFTVFMTLSIATGCGDTDADVASRDKGSAKTIINMPDKFPNVAVKCYEGNGIYVSNNTSSGSGAPYVVQNDPVCGETP